MSLIINRQSPAPGEMWIADRRLYVTADRSRLVEENDPEAAFLLVSAGKKIAADVVTGYGLIKAEDGTLQRAPSATAPIEPVPSADPSPDAQPAKDHPPTKAKKRAG